MHGLASTLFLEDLNIQMMVSNLIVNWILERTWVPFPGAGLVLDQDVGELCVCSQC